MAEKFVMDEDGQGLIEYVLILSLVTIVVIAALTVFGLTVKNHYGKTVNEIAKPMGG